MPTNPERMVWAMVMVAVLTLLIERSDLPGDFPNIETLYPVDEVWINPGDSLIVAPGGEVVAGPLSKEKGYLIFDIDAELALTSKRALDVAGHYSRPDIFTLEVNKEKRRTLTFKGDNDIK
ncbi:hypothetical protein A9Q98_04265 [Thalassotalea sp. 42_200_T64]|nr:hypothetical protein A9Q98_04265 [Thalassotalea sp. 42_200_T64]